MIEIDIKVERITSDPSESDSFQEALGLAIDQIYEASGIPVSYMNRPTFTKDDTTTLTELSLEEKHK